MTILQIAILAAAALVLGRLRGGRQLVMLAVSTFVVFWLQPAQPFITLGYWMPVLTLAVTILAWALTVPPESSGWKQNRAGFAVVAGVSLLMDLNRYFKLDQVYLTATPRLILALASLLGIAILALWAIRWQKARSFWLTLAFIGILAVFIVLKTPLLMKLLMDTLSPTAQTGQRQIGVISWLGFSYIAFRLLHTIRDKQTGRLPAVTLAEYLNYVIFFPSFTAGPIDRIERFVKDLRAPLGLSNEDWVDAGSRLFVGLFKKFVVADLLAVISLSDVLVTQVKYAGWMWVFLYAFAFRIYFDFSGYTDIAIGLGRLMGVRLPENFAAPYLKPNLTQFWNSWHMTLTQWFRAYFFNPLTRAMRSGPRPLPVWWMVLISQISTMVLIGLWHGVTPNFVLWGLWHGIGLFAQNRWSELVRNRLPAWTQSGAGQRFLNSCGVFLTFNFVAIGWLFFNLSTPDVAWQALHKLFGLT